MNVEICEVCGTRHSALECPKPKLQFIDPATAAPPNPAPDEIWTTHDGRKIPVGEMEEAHVRDALRMVIRRARRGEERRKQKLAIKRRLESLAREMDIDLEESRFEDKKWGSS